MNLKYLFIKLFAFSIVQIAMSTALKPPVGEALPIKPPTFKLLSDKMFFKK